jgi:hypothetical protein
MQNFKIRDLMVTIQPQSAGHSTIHNCDQHSKPGDTTGCTSCTHVTTGDETKCTSCTHQTSVTCKPHSKHEQKQNGRDALKVMELDKLKKAVARLQEGKYA